jgi:hypothetical protein
MDRYIPQGLDGIFTSTLNYLQTGFTLTNQIQGLIIALIAVFVMKKWSQIWLLGLVSAVIFVLVDHMVPIIRGGAPLRLPNVVSPDFWQKIAGVYVGFLVILTVFYFIKSTVLKGAGGGAPAKAK